MIVDKDTKTIQWRKVFSDNGVGTIVYLHSKNGVDPYVIPYTKLRPKWIKVLNVGAKTTKFLEENRGKSSRTTGFGNNFWIQHQKCRRQKQK